MSEFRLPTDTNLWYNKDPELILVEQDEMATACPNAQLGFLISAKALYWIIEISFADIQWKFMLLYHNDFPITPISVIPMFPKSDILKNKLTADAGLYFSIDSIVGYPCINLPGFDIEYHPASEYIEALQIFLNQFSAA